MKMKQLGRQGQNFVSTLVSMLIEKMPQKIPPKMLLKSKLRIYFVGTALGLSLALLFADANAQDVRTQFVTKGDGRLSNPLHPYDNLNNESLAKDSPVKETAGCRVFEPWQPVVLAEGAARNLGYEGNEGNVSRPGVFAVSSNAFCIKVGVPVHLVIPIFGSGFYADIGWFMPTGLSAADPAYASTQFDILIASGLAGAQDPVLFVSGRTIAPLRNRSGGLLGPRVDGVRVIDRSQLEAVIANSATSPNATKIVDVRNRNEFEKVQIKGSINLPYFIGKRFNLNSSPAQYGTEGDRFDANYLNANQPKSSTALQSNETSIIVVGQAIGDASAMRAANLLAWLGHKKVFLFYEGIEYFLGNASVTPTASNNVRLVNGVELNAILLNPALKTEIIDVRSPHEFSQGALVGSWLAPYLDNGYRAQGLSVSKILASGENISLPNTILKTATLVVVGSAETDFRSYKAALILSSRGYRNIYWYRNGFADWSRMAKLNPMNFKIALYPKLPIGYVGRPNPLTNQSGSGATP